MSTDGRIPYEGLTTTKRRKRVDYICNEIVAYVQIYFEKWHEPIPDSAVNRRFGREIAFYGGKVKAEIYQLVQAGRLLSDINRDGVMTLAPGLQSWEDPYYILASRGVPRRGRS
jgi:hypothetical protein